MAEGGIRGQIPGGRDEDEAEDSALQFLLRKNTVPNEERKSHLTGNQPLPSPMRPEKRRVSDGGSQREAEFH